MIQLFRNNKYTPYLLLAAAILIVFAAFALYVPPGADYYSVHPAAVQFINGESSLYDTSARYYNAPWFMLILAPLAFLPFKIGSAALTTMSLISILAAVILFFPSSRPRISPAVIILSLLMPPTMNLLGSGQVDAFVLLGIGLGWYAIRQKRPVLLSLALLLISVKPFNVVLILLLFLFLIRKWKLAEWVKVASLPILAIIISGIVIGFDWPVRWLTHMQKSPPIYGDTLSAPWLFFSNLGIPATLYVGLLIMAFPILLIVILKLIRKPDTAIQSILLTLVFGFFVSPYVQGWHYVLLTPVFIFIAGRDWRWGSIAYLTSWIPPIRVFLIGGDAWIDAVYLVILLVAVPVIIFREWDAHPIDQAVAS